MLDLKYLWLQKLATPELFGLTFFEKPIVPTVVFDCFQKNMESVNTLKQLNLYYRCITYIVNHRKSIQFHLFQLIFHSY